MISGYNVEAPKVNNLMMIVGKELSLYGFIVTTLLPKYQEDFYREVPGWIADGTIKYTEDVTKGLEYAGHAFEAVQRGTNKGKSVVLVAEE